MDGLLLAVPNISEGTRTDVVAEISANHSTLVDVHMDADHNRSVLTVAGDAQSVLTDVLEMSRRCIQMLDLTTHDGVHPRFGVVDVLAFVAYGCPDAAAFQAADAAVRFFVRNLHVGVHRYGLPDYPDLPTLRAQLRSFAGPDAVDQHAHPTAGVACIGVRKPMIAFNVNLQADTATAQAIARRIRERDGGLRGLRALGLGLPRRGVSQVSMNLIEPAITGPALAYSAVVDAANALGASVVEAELVGLAPDNLLGQFDGIPMRERPRSIERAVGTGPRPRTK